MNATQLQVLKDEITIDPLSRGYSGMDNQQIADDLNTEYRQCNLDTMTASQVFNAIDKAEFNGLTDANKQLVWDILHLGEINPFGLEANIFVDIFGAGSDTINALAGIRKVPHSRAQELNLPKISAGYVAHAKSF